uniref:7TM_GPCR_Srx domain-containing protein n=1 Tax=Caenorhabditis tropicalis TaxID=1561998 RepID=A0A1I7U4H6_9PELO
MDRQLEEDFAVRWVSFQLLPSSKIVLICRKQCGSVDRSDLAGSSNPYIYQVAVSDVVVINIICIYFGATILSQLIWNLRNHRLAQFHSNFIKKCCEERLVMSSSSILFVFILEQLYCYSGTGSFGIIESHNFTLILLKNVVKSGDVIVINIICVYYGAAILLQRHWKLRINRLTQFHSIFNEERCE